MDNQASVADEVGVGVGVRAEHFSGSLKNSFRRQNIFFFDICRTITTGNSETCFFCLKLDRILASFYRFPNWGKQSISSAVSDIVM